MSQTTLSGSRVGLFIGDRDLQTLRASLSARNVASYDVAAAVQIAEQMRSLHRHHFLTSQPPQKTPRAKRMLATMEIGMVEQMTAFPVMLALRTQNPGVIEAMLQQLLAIEQDIPETSPIPRRVAARYFFATCHALKDRLCAVTGNEKMAANKWSRNLLAMVMTGATTWNKTPAPLNGHEITTGMLPGFNFK